MIGNRSKSHTEPVDAPVAGWLPLHRAKFFFYPDYAAPGAEFDRAIEKLARWVTRPDMSLPEMSMRIADPCVLKIDCRSASLIVNAGEGSLQLEHITGNDNLVLFRNCMPWDHPEKFFHILSGEDPLPEFAEEVKALVGVAQSIWRNLLDGFEVARENGLAQLMGRKGSPDREFTQIHPDQWRYFKETAPVQNNSYEWVCLTAEGPSGQIIYSPYVAPVQKAENPTERRKNRKRDCVIQLAEMMSVSPMKSTMTKEEIGEWAQRQFGPDFSPSAIDECRKKAIDSAKALGWKTPGRPKKNS